MRIKPNLQSALHEKYSSFQQEEKIEKSEFTGVGASFEALFKATGAENINPARLSCSN